MFLNGLYMLFLAKTVYLSLISRPSRTFFVRVCVYSAPHAQGLHTFTVWLVLTYTLVAQRHAQRPGSGATTHLSESV